MSQTRNEFPSSHPFTYEHMFNNRKDVPICQVNGIEYDSIFNGGWLRIRTPKGVGYYSAQARLYHLTPDWKLHFSIANQDLPLAWNILGHLFLEKNCNMSMKMKVADYDNDHWPEHMQGREITVYIYQHEKIYESLSGGALSKHDQLPREYWLDFISEAEARLKQAQVVSRGTANGDKAMGDYCSLRNETFVKWDPEWKDVSNRCEVDRQHYCYPPNVVGFNAVNDINPLLKPQQSCSPFFAKTPTRLHQKVLNHYIKEVVLPDLKQSELSARKKPEQLQPPMKTLHILQMDEQCQKTLIHALYRRYLKDDPLFHFFYEPDLIIRLSVKDVIDKIAAYLSKNEIKFTLYDYPLPERTMQRVYGETPDGIVMQHLNLFLPIFHAHAVAVVSLHDDEHVAYMERTIHTMFNPKAYTRHEEGEYLAMLSSMKINRAIQVANEEKKTESVAPQRL